MVTMTSSADTDRISPIAGIHPALSQALAEKGYSQLTPVQLAMTNAEHGEADLLVVLAERAVPDVVQPVLDPPVAPDQLRRALGDSAFAPGGPTSR